MRCSKKNAVLYIGSNSLAYAWMLKDSWVRLQQQQKQDKNKQTNATTQHSYFHMSEHTYVSRCPCYLHELDHHLHHWNTWSSLMFFNLLHILATLGLSLLAPPKYQTTSSRHSLFQHHTNTYHHNSTSHFQNILLKVPRFTINLPTHETVRYRLTSPLNIYHYLAK